MVQWLKLSASPASPVGGVGMIPGPETESPHTIGTAKKKKKAHISISTSLK